MRCRWKTWIAAIVITAALLLFVLFFRLNLTAPPPSVSITLLGYTNRVGPHAMLAITNHSRTTIALDPICLVAYSPTRGIEPRRPTSFEGNKTATRQLAPGKGFVQEVFVFPGGGGEWQFQCYAAYSSAFLDFRSSLEKRLNKFLRRVGLPPASNASRPITTEWRDCPD